MTSDELKRRLGIRDDAAYRIDPESGVVQREGVFGWTDTERRMDTTSGVFQTEGILDWRDSDVRVNPATGVVQREGWFGYRDTDTRIDPDTGVTQQEGFFGWRDTDERIDPDSGNLQSRGFFGWSDVGGIFGESDYAWIFGFLLLPIILFIALLGAMFDTSVPPVKLLKRLALTHLIVGSFLTLVSIIATVLAFGNNRLSPLDTLIFLSLVVLYATSIIAGAGLLRRQHWAISLLLVLGVVHSVNFLMFPMMLVGIYTLFVLFRARKLVFPRRTLFTRTAGPSRPLPDSSGMS